MEKINELAESEIDEKILSIFSENGVQLNGSHDERKLSEMGVNSIVFIKVVVALESTFDFEFDDEALDYSKFEYFQQLCDYVKQKKNA